MTMLVFIVLCCLFNNLLASSDIGPGTWYISYYKGCEIPKPTFEMNVFQKKQNRTHNVVSGQFKFHKDLDETNGIRLEVCKECDGGCKPYQLLTDFNIVDFANKYIKDNIETCFGNSNIDPPRLPLKAGEYDIVDYAYDITELPKTGPYGSFIGMAYILDKFQKKAGCLEIHAEFLPDEEE